MIWLYKNIIRIKFKHEAINSHRSPRYYFGLHFLYSIVLLQSKLEISTTNFHSKISKIILSTSKLWRGLVLKRICHPTLCFQVLFKMKESLYWIQLKKSFWFWSTKLRIIEKVYHQLRTSRTFKDWKNLLGDLKSWALLTWMRSQSIAR